ncbi:hypothetical protein [Stenotrophomonas rhizophila]|uniref:hypothetical protein n=1 Tax=Stenotrophomonas rhizophila TaxID=216778 RepID=UPI00112F6D80|nr:hypothetical protein [Stenotrophomonas rhizophila]
MGKKRVPLHQNPRGFVDVDPDATPGAQVGVNLLGPDGKVLTAAQVINPVDSGSSGGPNGISSTVWKLIREIPLNIQKLAALVGRGFAIRRDDGEWAVRTLQAGDGIDITNPDGEAGDPAISLEDLPDSGIGAALVKITRDAKGRVSGTAAATTDDLPQGAINKYFPEAPIDGYPYVRGSSSWQALDGPSSPYYLLKFAVLTDQAGNVLTDQQGRVLMANTPAIPYSWISGVPANLVSVAGLTGSGYAFRDSGGAWSLVTPASLMTLPAMTLAAANALTGVADFQMVAITDLAGGREPCWYDATVASGTKWRRFSDRSIAN